MEYLLSLLGYLASATLFIACWAWFGEYIGLSADIIGIVAFALLLFHGCLSKIKMDHGTSFFGAYGYFLFWVPRGRLAPTLAQNQ